MLITNSYMYSLSLVQNQYRMYIVVNSVVVRDRLHYIRRNYHIRPRKAVNYALQQRFA